MTVSVHYKVPLVARIDVEGGEVLSVHIADESIEGPLTVTSDAGTATEAERQRAIQIAETTMWPGWTAGW